MKKVKIGDYVKGSWKDSTTGRTYFTEGVVVKLPAGLFVQQDNGCITPLEDVFHFSQIIKKP